MQKKLIVLAVAGLLSAPAFAQSGITLYGTIDFGYTSLGSNDVKGIKSRNAIDSGVSKANRIGFKGVEDLGNGLKAVFVLEEGLNGDAGSLWKSDGRQSYAGLAGGFGTAVFGRHYTPQHLFTSAVDPFDKEGLGSSGNVLMQDVRLNNLVAYVSPNWGGFSFIAGWTWNGLAQENLENDGDARIWAIAPSFTWNKLFVGANYHTARIHNAHASNVKALNVYDLYTSYDFGFVKLGATIGRRTTRKEVFGWDKDAKLTQWMLGATFRLTPNDSILTSYSRAAENKVWNGQDGRPRIGQWAIGYEHALSKRTVLYSQFAAQSHNRQFKNGGFHSLVTDGLVGSVAASNLEHSHGQQQRGNEYYRRGFTVGFRHDF
jgi:predicted porin